MNISFIIPTYKSSEDLRSYLISFLKYNSPEGLSFSIVDTSQDIDLLKIEQEFSGRLNIKVHFIQNKGYAFACNYGYQHAPESDLYIFSNADIIFNSNVIVKIKEVFDENTYGTIIQKNKKNEKCTFNLYPQYRNIITELLFLKKLLNWLNWYNPNYISISGAFMILGKNVIKDNGLFDTQYFLYYEEDDYFYRLRKNRNFKIIKDRYVVHNVSSSIDKNLTINKFKIQADSLFYYSKKFNNYTHFRSLKMLYKIFSLFIPKFRERLNFLLAKEINNC